MRLQTLCTTALVLFLVHLQGCASLIHQRSMQGIDPASATAKQVEPESFDFIPLDNIRATADVKESDGTVTAMSLGEAYPGYLVAIPKGGKLPFGSLISPRQQGKALSNLSVAAPDESVTAICRCSFVRRWKVPNGETRTISMCGSGRTNSGLVKPFSFEDASTIAVGPFPEVLCWTRVIALYDIVECQNFCSACTTVFCQNLNTGEVLVEMPGDEPYSEVWSPCNIHNVCQ